MKTIEINNLLLKKCSGDDKRKDVLERVLISKELNRLLSVKVQEAYKWESPNILEGGLTVYPEEIKALETVALALIPGILFQDYLEMGKGIIELIDVFIQLRHEGVKISAEERVLYFAVKREGREGIPKEKLLEIKNECAIKTKVDMIISKLLAKGIFIERNGNICLHPKYIV